MISMGYKYKSLYILKLCSGPKCLNSTEFFDHQHCRETAKVAERELCALQRSLAIKDEAHTGTLCSVIVQTTEQKDPAHQRLSS